MGTFYGGLGSDKKIISDLLLLLDTSLKDQKALVAADRCIKKTVKLLHCIHEISAKNKLDSISTLTYHVSSILLDTVRLDLPINQKLLAHLFVTKSVISESFERCTTGRLPVNKALTNALIDSLKRSIQEILKEGKTG
jgi:hypothetical protein